MLFDKKLRFFRVIAVNVHYTLGFLIVVGLLVSIPSAVLIVRLSQQFYDTYIVVVFLVIKATIQK